MTPLQNVNCPVHLLGEDCKQSQNIEYFTILKQVFVCCLLNLQRMNIFSYSGYAL